MAHRGIPMIALRKMLDSISLKYIPACESVLLSKFKATVLKVGIMLKCDECSMWHLLKAN